MTERLDPARILVSLTFDDGLPSHLDVAMPVLEGEGLRGTFYVPVGDEAFTDRHRDWAAAAARGHELGNHSIFHPGVSTKRWVTPGIAIDDYNLDRMARELKAANAFLEVLDGQVERSYAFPCSNPWLGRQGWPRRALQRLGLQRTRIAGWVDRYRLDVGATLVDYTPVVRPRFLAARCGGIEAQCLPALPPDRHRIRGVDGDGATLAQLEAAVDQAIDRRAFLPLVFHGVGGGHRLSVDTDVLQGLCKRLASDARVQVLTLRDAARKMWSAA
jgi:peptidoglycan-N-acetylglucosamine deacetylase